MKPDYATTSNASAGAQTAYTAGLSYFPDYSFAPEPMGDVAQIIGGLVGAGVAGPAGATAGTTVGTLIGSLTGGGSAVDAQRQARVNYVLAAAQRGNVPAAQMIIAGPQNVSGNEAGMWTNAQTALRSTVLGAQTLAAAQAAGPYWPVNSGDTAANYPFMRSVIAQWDAQHPSVSGTVAGVTGVVNSVLGLSPGSSISPTTVLLGVAALGAFLLLSRKRGA